MRNIYILFIILSFPITMTLSNINKENNELTAAIPVYFPPQYSTDENGIPSGFAIDIIDYIASKAGYKINYIIKEDWNKVYHSLKTGEADIIPNYGITEKRIQDFYFTIPVETFEISIFIRKSTSNISNIDDLPGNKVAVVKGNAAIDILKQNTEIELIISDSINDALFGLLSGNVDALVYPKPVVLKASNDIGVQNRIKIVGDPLIEIKRGIAINTDNKYLINIFNNIIEDFIGSNDYRVIYTKWYGKKTPFWTIKTLTILMVIILIILFLIMFSWRHISLIKLNKELSTNITKCKKLEKELITHRDKLEEMVKERTKKLTETNSELESFSYSVSHDLRSPLRAIQGFSRLLLEDYSDKLDKEGLGYLNRIAQSVNRMRILIDDLLAFSRTSRRDINKIDIEIRKIIVDVYNELINENGNLNRKIDFNIKNTINFKGDIIMIQQVFINLIANALKFTKNNKKTRIEIGANTQKDQIIYYIKDNGVGFEEEYKDKLFGVFQRLHNINEFDGTGIGLALVQRIISKHGGKVWAESKSNEGATFYFSIPK